MDKKEWDRVERNLKFGYPTQNLECDGYRVAIGLIKKSLCRSMLAVLYINGSFKGRWILDDCEERKRFLYPKKMYVFPPRIRAKAKRLPKEYRELYNRSGIYYSPAFPGMSALRSHFEANNATIKLLDPRESEARESE